MLIALNRRIPRTKSVFERTSSRRYSSFDYDLNVYDNNHNDEQIIIDNNNNPEDIRQNHLNLIDTILRQNEDGFVSLNGHENFIISFNNNDDNDEYALPFIFTL